MSHRLSTSLPGFHNDLRIGQCAVFTSEESAHVGEGVTEIQFIALTFHIAKVGGTQHARVTQQGMVDIYQRLLLEDVQRREARPAPVQGFEQRSWGDQFGAAGIDQQGAGFHQRQIGGRDEVTGGFDKAQVQAEYIGLGEERCTR